MPLVKTTTDSKLDTGYNHGFYWIRRLGLPWGSGILIEEAGCDFRVQPQRLCIRDQSFCRNLITLGRKAWYT